MKRIRAHLSYANVAATLAVLFAMSGGAIAATGGFSSGGTLRACVNEEGGVKLLKAGGHCGKGRKTVSWNAAGRAGVNGSTGAAGAPGAAGAQGKEGSRGLQGPEGEPGTARAFAAISESGVLDPARSKNIASVKLEGAGIYCITLSAAAKTDSDSAAPVATPDAAGASGFVQGINAYVETRPVTCSGGQLEVLMRQVTVSGGTMAEANHDSGFTVVVP